jgi:hypothetical protein
MDDLKAKQFGDACEYFVLAELMLAGWPAIKMPDGWPGHDLSVSSPSGETIRISVKGLRFGRGKLASFYRFNPNGWDWLALVRVNVETDTRQFFLLPHDQAMALSVAESNTQRRINHKNPGLAAYEGNVALNPIGDAIVREIPRSFP